MKSLVTISLAALAAHSFANVLSNGGFELNTTNTGISGYAGDVPDNWSIFNDLYPGNSPDTWDNNGSGGDTPGTGGAFPHVTAFQGTKWVGLAGEIGNFGWTEGIESNAFGLNPGVTYTLSLNMIYDQHTGPGYNQPGNLTIRLRKLPQNAGLLTVFANNVAPDQWEQRSFNFSVAVGGFYALVISNEDARKSYIGVDNVELNVVPEPSSLAVVAIASVMFLRRARRGCRAKIKLGIGHQMLFAKTLLAAGGNPSSPER